MASTRLTTLACLLQAPSVSVMTVALVAQSFYQRVELTTHARRSRDRETVSCGVVGHTQTREEAVPLKTIRGKYPTDCLSWQSPPFSVPGLQSPAGHLYFTTPENRAALNCGAGGAYASPHPHRPQAFPPRCRALVRTMCAIWFGLAVQAPTPPVKAPRALRS